MPERSARLGMSISNVEDRVSNDEIVDFHFRRNDMLCLHFMKEGEHIRAQVTSAQGIE